jgi:hypothetical protein
MAQAATSFTAVGAGASLVLTRRGKTVDYSISGTYVGTIEIQKAQSPAQSAWQTILGPFVGNNTTFTGSFTDYGDNSVCRMLCTVFTSGTIVTTLTDREQTDIAHKNAAGIVSSVIRESGAAIVFAEPYSVGSAKAVTVEEHAGRWGLLDTLTGSTVTLPAAVGSGAEFKFRVSVLATSNNHKIQVANANDVMQGIILAGGDTATTVVNHWATSGTSDTITLNRTTTGSTQLGEYVKLTDVGVGKWQVEGFLEQTGTEATPFSAAV